MNKKLVSAAVLLGLSGAATAVHLNPDGIGQVLLYPYYTTNAEMQTQVMVVNTTDQAKAVKVRFKEGVNSWEVLDFNLYLSPYDTWTGLVFQDKEGNTKLGTRDTSCVSPYPLPDLIVKNGVIEGGQPFNPLNITKWGSKSDEPKESETGLSAKDRLKEGYLEIIEMGNADIQSDFGKEWKAAVTHVQGGMKPTPKNCNLVREEWGTGGKWATNSRTGMAPVSGGLFGTARMIDIAHGIDRGYDATAIDSFWRADDPELPGVQGVVAHSSPGDSYPDLAGRLRYKEGGGLFGSKADRISYVAVSENGRTVVKKTRFDESMDALSSVLMVDKIYNQFLINSDIGAETDWIVNFPTKHAYINPNTSEGSRANTGSGSEGQFGLLTEYVGNHGNCYIPSRDSEGYCEPFDGGFDVTVAPVIYGAEEQREVPTLNFSPSSRPSNAIAYEVNVLSFGKSAALGAKGTNVFNSALGNRIKTSYPSGWAWISFADGQISGTDPDTNKTRVFRGRPVIGFASIAAKKNDASANYAELFNHKYSRNVSTPN